MRLDPRCVVFVMLLLVPATAQAHLHVWDFAFSGAEASGSSLKGVRMTVGITQKVGTTNKDFSWLLDVTNVFGEDANQHDITQVSYLGGGRYTIPRLRHKYVVASLHGMAGKVFKHALDAGSNVASRENHWSFNTGAAIELGDAKGWAGRIQADYSFVKGGVGYRQFSAGVVKRFEP